MDSKVFGLTLKKPFVNRLTFSLPSRYFLSIAKRNSRRGSNLANKMGVEHVHSVIPFIYRSYHKLINKLIINTSYLLSISVYNHHL